MQEAFCRLHQDDVAIGPDRFCPTHKTLTIPPSWASKQARYPYKERPEGYRYAAPVFLAAKTAPVSQESVSLAAICEHCQAVYTRSSRKAGSQRYCSDVCKSRAYNARLRARRIEREALPGRPCDHCGTTYRPIAPKRGGHPSAFCSEQCQRARSHAADPRLLANRGAA